MAPCKEGWTLTSLIFVGLVIVVSFANEEADSAIKKEANTNREEKRKTTGFWN